jgi:hypothetical protein
VHAQRTERLFRIVTSEAPMKPVVIALLSAAMLHAQSAATEFREIAERAYIYAYPLVLLGATRGAQTVNQFTHVPQFPRPDIQQIVRPNADTLYSTAWLDLAKEPILIHVPDSDGRFYFLQFMRGRRPSPTLANEPPGLKRHGCHHRTKLNPEPERESNWAGFRGWAL